MKTIYIFILVVLVFVGIFFFTREKPASVSEETKKEEMVTEEETTRSTETPGQVTTYTPPVAKHTMIEVAVHNNEFDCWSAINGNVYNLTAWVSSHPGGKQAIVGLCGKDGSAAFNGQHGGRVQQESQLAQFKIGVLTQ